ncbi:MAG TPA: type II secretion system protein [Candidatus Faecisoma merdavium]|nr:type II secretion system protein [Candidatus Faecisoma merdavium]
MKKGFTLVELLAVIVILGVLTLITFPIIDGTIKNSKEKALASTIKSIEDAAYNYSTKNDIGYQTYYKKITLDELAKSGLLDNEIINPVTNNKMNGCVLYKWVEEYKQYEFKYDEECNNTVPDSISFAEDSWETIHTIVEMGLASDFYNVGDTKEVAIDGYTNGSESTFTVRIANMSTPAECSNEGFSQTACGFVVEFVDIIATIAINSSESNANGWPASEMYSFVNNTIYNSLPTELKNIIINTYSVSGHGSSDSYNFTSTDKLYLFSTKEVWGKDGESNTISGDSAEYETRQLDYYKNKETTTDNYSGAIKNYQDEAYIWWLRTAQSSDFRNFYCVDSLGSWALGYPYYTYGLAPSFRIG